jgi:guanylate kinase
MAGEKNTAETLNNTLLFIIKLLNENNIKNWFIGYGTLLGIIRNNSCIEGDDDVDIIIDKINYDIVKKVLLENNFIFEDGYDNIDNKNFLKTKNNDQYASVDFYMSSLDEEGNFNDTWEKVIWGECYNEKNELIEYIWNGHILYIPANYEKKLFNRYGETWKIPQNTKGPMPRKFIL